MGGGNEEARWLERKPRVRRKTADVEALLGRAFRHHVFRGGSRFPNKTYEQGLADAIFWLVGEQSDNPYPAEES